MLLAFRRKARDSARHHAGCVSRRPERLCEVPSAGAERREARREARRDTIRLPFRRIPGGSPRYHAASASQKRREDLKLSETPYCFAFRRNLDALRDTMLLAFRREARGKSRGKSRHHMTCVSEKPGRPAEMPCCWRFSGKREALLEALRDTIRLCVSENPRRLAETRCCLRFRELRRLAEMPCCWRFAERRGSARGSVRHDTACVSENEPLRAAQYFWIPSLARVRLW